MEIIPIDFNTFCNKIILETGHKNIMYLSIFIDFKDDKLKKIFIEYIFYKDIYIVFNTVIINKY